MTAEPLYAPVSDRGTYVAVPPSGCLNGCARGQGDARTPVETEGAALLCPSCVTRLARWLREIPESYALLPAVKDHGTVPGNPETAHTKRPDAPAPMRLEITDLLDTRYYEGRGVLGLIHGWAQLIRDERHLPGPDQQPTVTGECLLLSAHLPWATEQAWIEDLHAELKALARELREAVGEYTIRPVGTCKTTPAGQHDGVCGGPLFMDKTQTAVRCASCGQRQEADSGLRELGLKVGLIGEAS